MSRRVHTPISLVFGRFMHNGTILASKLHGQDTLLWTPLTSEERCVGREPAWTSLGIGAGAWPDPSLPWVAFGW